MRVSFATHSAGHARYGYLMRLDDNGRINEGEQCTAVEI